MKTEVASENESESSWPEPHLQKYRGFFVDEIEYDADVKKMRKEKKVFSTNIGYILAEKYYILQDIT